jgi:hypothetical protein
MTRKRVLHSRVALQAVIYCQAVIIGAEAVHTGDAPAPETASLSQLVEGINRTTLIAGVMVCLIVSGLLVIPGRGTKVIAVLGEVVILAVAAAALARHAGGAASALVAALAICGAVLGMLIPARQPHP